MALFTTKKMVISGDFKLPLMTEKLPLLPNSGDKLPLFSGCCRLDAIAKQQQLLESPLMTNQQKVAANHFFVAGKTVKNNVEVAANDIVVAATFQLPLMICNQQRLVVAVNNFLVAGRNLKNNVKVAANDVTLAATLQLPLMISHQRRRKCCR